MTDKQIINEKDLDTPCPHHCSNTIGQCLNISKDTPSPYCIYNKDCIYKQYARKEQECEQQKAELELFKTSNQTTIDQLKSENKELTSKCSQLEEFTRKTRNIILKFAKGDILTFPDLSLEENCIAIQKQCLDPMRQIIQKLDEMQDENCHFDKIKKLTKEM